MNYEIIKEKHGYVTAKYKHHKFMAKGKDEIERILELHDKYGSGNFESIKVKWTGYARSRISEYNSDFSNVYSDLFLSAVNRQKTNIVIVNPAEAHAVLHELSSYRSEQRVWMNGMMDNALDRVAGEILSELPDMYEEEYDCYGNLEGLKQVDFDSEYDC